MKPLVNDKRDSVSGATLFLILFFYNIVMCAISMKEKSPETETRNSKKIKDIHGKSSGSFAGGFFVHSYIYYSLNPVSCERCRVLLLGFIDKVSVFTTAQYFDKFNNNPLCKLVRIYSANGYKTSKF